MDDHLLKPGRKKTGGRKKGVPNKTSVELKDMILGALSDVGGQTYLARQAEENPQAFMGLVGKCLPKDIKASVDSTGQINVVITRFTDAPAK